MKLSSMHIDYFRSIKNCTVYFNELTAIVGENNAGKTAILRALNSVFNYNYEEKYFIDNTHQYAPRHVTKIVLTFEDVPSNELYLDKIFNNKFILIFQYSYSNKRKKRSLFYQTSAGLIALDEYFIESLKADIDFIYIPANRGSKDLTWTDNSIFQRLIISYLHEYTKNRDTLSQQIITAAGKIRSNVLTKLDRELTALNMFDNKGEYQTDFSTTIDYSIFLDKLGINLIEGGINLPVIEYGSGIKSLTVIALHRMYARSNSVNIILGIEEPETNLHPQAQKKLIASLKKNRQECETQAIFATHSPVIIDELNHQEIILVRRKKDEKRGFYSITTQLTPDFWEKHGISELKHYNFFKYKNSDFFFSKYVVLTESVTDAQVVDKLLESHFDANYYNISILNLDGIKNLKYPFFLLRDLGIPFSAVVDKDFLTPYLNDKLNNSRNPVTFLPEYKNILNEKNPVIKTIFDSEEKKNILGEKLLKSYTRLFDYLKDYNLFPMQYCLEMDLITSPKAANLYYDHFDIPEGQRVPKKLLVDRCDAIKDPAVVLKIINQLQPKDYPYSFKKITTALTKTIMPFL